MPGTGKMQKNISGETGQKIQTFLTPVRKCLTSAEKKSVDNNRTRICSHISAPSHPRQMNELTSEPDDETLARRFGNGTKRQSEKQI